MRTPCLPTSPFALVALLVFLCSGQVQAQNARFFHQEIDWDGQQLTFQFDVPEAMNFAAPNIATYLYYRVNRGSLQSVVMNELVTGREYEVALEGVRSGDVIDFYYQQILDGQFAELPVDTAWFRYLVGVGMASEPTFPMQVSFGARFRDRHEGEGRFDQYVTGYSDGTMFETIITDYGTHVHIEVVTDAETDNADIRYSDHVGVPDPLNLDPDFCWRAEFDYGGDMAQIDNHRWDYTIEDVKVGMLLDIEFTFKRVDSQQQYYTEIFRYRVGDGRLSPEYNHPYFAVNHTSPSMITVRTLAFNQHIIGLSADNLRKFLAGKTLFDTDFEGDFLNNQQPAYDCIGDMPSPKVEVSPPSTFETPIETAGKLGPLLNSTSCFECHFLDGRGRPPETYEAPMESMLMRLSIAGTDTNGGPMPHPVYGGQLQDKDDVGGGGEGRAHVTYTISVHEFLGSGTYELATPDYSFSGLIDEPIDGSTIMHSPRVAPQLVGLGLLEALSDETILEWEDELDADGDGIRGVANLVWSAAEQQMMVGRYGWKAEAPTLKDQAAAAAFNDIGLSNPLFGGGDELSDADLDSLVDYLSQLAVPPRTDYLNAAAIRGKEHFFAAGCASCHRPAMKTREDYPNKALAGKTVQAFTDLLLHDMGPELADNRPTYKASGQHWRTPPLWGLQHIQDVNGHMRLLHDGRARGIMEAIMWHGGEAEDSRRYVSQLGAAERDDLVAYVKFPFIDPMEHGLSPDKNLLSTQLDPSLLPPAGSTGYDPCTYIEALPNGDLRFSVQYPEAKTSVQAFIRKDTESLMAAPNITDSAELLDGLYTYSYTLSASLFQANDPVQVRFYADGDFTPGPFEAFCDPFLYGSADPCGHNAPSPSGLDIQLQVERSESGNQVHVSFQSWEGFLYQLQSSDDLLLWTDEGAVLDGNNDRLELDLDLPAGQKRFYRVEVSD